MRVALVIHRYGPEVVGGSETLARQYAQLLDPHCDVEVLTTCAIDHMTWANHYTAGRWEVEGITVRRFANDFKRTPYWGGLYDMLLGKTDVQAFPSSAMEKAGLARRLADWPIGLQEELIRWQGPYSSTFFRYLQQYADDYDAFLFFTYLFPTTYFGMRLVQSQKVVLCPTLHDEPIAYLPIFKETFEIPRSFVFLTRAEQSLAIRLFGVTQQASVIGMAFEPQKTSGQLPTGTPAHFILYAGRFEASKGTDCLVQDFLEYKRRHPSNLKLVMIGSIGSKLPQHPEIVHLGFVSAAVKTELMKHAVAFVHPSPYESFGIVLLESFAAGTPALVNGHNEVLMEHAQASGGASGYRTTDEYCSGLNRLVSDSSYRSLLAERGRDYVDKHFQPAPVAQKLVEAITSRSTNARTHEGGLVSSLLL